MFRSFCSVTTRSGKVVWRGFCAVAILTALTLVFALPTQGAWASSPGNRMDSVQEIPYRFCPEANNDPGIAPYYYLTGMDQNLSVSAPGVLSNDTKPEEAPALIAVSPSDPEHGSVTLDTDGSFVYTPDSGYVGMDSFTYYAREGIDGYLSETPAAVTIKVNAIPVAVDDAYQTNQDQELTVTAAGVLTNDTDADAGDTLIVNVQQVTDPAHGTVVLDADGSFVYTPTSGYYGSDSFTYKATDGKADSNSATVTITINAFPVAVDDSYVVNKDQTLTVDATGVLANDTDSDDATLTAVWQSGPSHGALTLNTDGSFEYIPATGYAGPDSFTYEACDDSDACSDPATVNIKVNTPPVAGNNTYSIATTNVPLIISVPGVLDNDTDADSDPLTVDLATVSDPPHGTVSMNTDGSFTYTSDSGYFGGDSFTYQATDGYALSNTATVSITVRPIEVSIIKMGLTNKLIHVDVTSHANTPLTITKMTFKWNGAYHDYAGWPGGIVIHQYRWYPNGYPNGANPVIKDSINEAVVQPASGQWFTNTQTTIPTSTRPVLQSGDFGTLVIRFNPTPLYFHGTDIRIIIEGTVNGVAFPVVEVAGIPGPQFTGASYADRPWLYVNGRTPPSLTVSQDSAHPTCMHKTEYYRLEAYAQTAAQTGGNPVRSVLFHAVDMDTDGGPHSMGEFDDTSADATTGAYCFFGDCSTLKHWSDAWWDTNYHMVSGDTFRYNMEVRDNGGIYGDLYSQYTRVFGGYFEFYLNAKPARCQ